MTDAERFKFLAGLVERYGKITIEKDTRGTFAYVRNARAARAGNTRIAIDNLMEVIETIRVQEVINALEGGKEPPF